MNDIETTLEVLQTLGPRLREHRYRLNLSLPEVGDIVGLTGRSIQAIERGWRLPSALPLMRLLDWMVRSADDPPRPGKSRELATKGAQAGFEARRRKELAGGS